MILAHLADLHLGFRSYERAVGGRNVREGDVTDAFLRAVEEIVRVSPDVILIAGDLFDRPDPPPAALVTLTRGLASVREALPATPVLITAGPRDRPTCPEEPGVLGAIDTLPGVAAATDTPRSVRVDDLAVALLPHGAPGAEAVPDEGARWNVLVAHARMRTAPAGKRGRSRAASRGAWGDPERILRVDPAAWSYVALGGEHAPHAPLPHVRWPGSLERVSWCPWDEAIEEKGFLTWDLERRAARFHPIPGRAVVSLAPIRVSSGQPDRLRRRVREVTDEVPGGDRRQDRPAARAQRGAGGSAWARRGAASCPARTRAPPLRRARPREPSSRDVWRRAPHPARGGARGRGTGVHRGGRLRGGAAE